MAATLCLSASVVGAQSAIEAWYRGSPQQTTHMVGIASRNAHVQFNLLCRSENPSIFIWISYRSSGWDSDADLHVRIGEEEFELFKSIGGDSGGHYGDIPEGGEAVSTRLLDAFATGTTMVLSGGTVAGIAQEARHFSMTGAAEAVSWLVDQCAKTSS